MRRNSLIFILFVLVLAGCESSPTKPSSSFSSSDRSRTTGWRMGDMTVFGFEDPKSVSQIVGPGLKFVEGGTFTMGRIDEDVMREWDNIPRRVTISSFYMDETEVTNFAYRQMLAWLQTVYKSKPDPTHPLSWTKYKQALPDTLVWRRELAYNEPWVNNYLRHPAYNNYPVVGVSWEQANTYCKWRTDRVNEYLLIESGKLLIDSSQVLQSATGDMKVFTTEGYLSGEYEGKIGDDTIKSRWENGLLLPNYRLPTEAEWEYAALGLIGEADGELLTERRMFPWEGEYIRDAEGGSMGGIKANFVRGRGDYMGMAGALNDKADITADVYSYDPNDYGLYNMSGNVNEWVADVYRPYSPFDVEEFQPFRGNEITQRDGFDEFGQPKNTLEADYRNYRDGDYQSALIEGNNWTALQPTIANADSTTQLMYSQSSDPGIINSFISDEVRVYKGGGWQDRVYWLNPGARRYLKQSESRSDIGFRCAMTHLGPSTQN